MKKLVCLLLTLTTLVGLTACGDPPPPPGGGGGDGGDGDPVVMENADLLAYSFDRIENADLSFNMSMNGTAAANATGSSVSDVTACGSGTDDTVIIENPDELAWVDFFENDKGLLEMIRDDSRRLCDLILEKVTVVNKIVHEGGMNYLLQYEGEGDVLTVYSFWGGVDGDSLEKAEEDDDGGVGDGPVRADKGPATADPVEAALGGRVRDLVRIQFYYDEDGDETVSYLNYGISYQEYYDCLWLNSMEVVYTPGKHYEIKSYNTGLDKVTLEKNSVGDLMNVTLADRSTGKWQGMSWSGSSSHPYFTKQGEYDVNNNIGISFIFETDEGLMQLGGKLQAYRDGYEIYHGECLESDEIRLNINSMTSELFWVHFAERRFEFALSLANINGWDRVVLDRSDEEDPYHLYLLGNDYVEFSNGMKLYGSNVNSTVWIDGVGFIKTNLIETNEGYYVEYIDEDGVAHDSDWFIEVGGEDYSKQIQFNGETYVDSNTDTAGTFFLDAMMVTVVDNPDIPVCTDPFGVLQEFFNAMGLSSKLQPDTDKTFAAIVGVYENRTQYMDALFRDWNGTVFNYDTLVEYIFDSFDAYENTLDGYSGFVSKHEVVDISMIPELPEDFALIAISGGISGSVTVSESGIDFSAISVAVERNILLGDQNEYGVCAALVGKTANELAGAFEVKAYANADMSIAGKAGIALPTALPEGEYTLSLYFGRKTEGSFARLSELVAPTVESFTSFEERVDMSDGYYTYAYSAVNGALHLSVTFTDTEAPAISLTGISTESDRIVMTLSEGALVSDLIANVTATDNRDGTLIITSANVLLMDTADGSMVKASDALVNGATYRIAVKDSSDNESAVNVEIRLN